MQSLETKSSRPKPKSFETETRPETFETENETSKNGPRDASRDRDQVSRLQHWCILCKDFDYNWWCSDLLPCYVTSVALQLQQANRAKTIGNPRW